VKLASMQIESLADAYGVNYLGTYITAASEEGGYPARAGSIIDRMCRGQRWDIYVTDWAQSSAGLVFDNEGQANCQLIGERPQGYCRMGTSRTVAATLTWEKARPQGGGKEPRAAMALMFPTA